MKSKKPIALDMGDSHLTDKNRKDVEDIWRQAKEICLSNGINRIFHGGDVFTARVAQPLSCLLSMMSTGETLGRPSDTSLGRTKKDLEDSGIIVDLIAGNHDKVDLESEFSYLSIFNSESFRVHGESFTEDFGDTVVHMLPYFPENGSYCDRLKKLESKIVKSKFNLLITHIGINGALGHESASTNKEVPSSIFSKFDKTLVHHYHNQLQVEGTNIYYTGSTHQQNFGEDPNKGFTLIYSDGSHEFIKAKFTEYHTVNIDVELADAKFLKKVKSEINSTGNKIRVILAGDESKLKSVNKKQFSDIGISKLILKDISVALSPQEKAQTFVSFTKSQIIKEYKEFSLSNELCPEMGLSYLSELKSNS